MKIKFLQLNINGGLFIDEVINFIKTNNIDVACFQEVNSGWLSVNEVDCFEYLKNVLSNSHNGVLTKTWETLRDNYSYFGNATFFKNTFELKSKDVIWLKEYARIKGFIEEEPKNVPRDCLSLTLESEGKQVQVLNTHLAWGPRPDDKPYKIEQAKKLYEYLKGVKLPFILSGDFNLTSDTKIVKMMEDLGRNLTVENKVTNTLNLSVHYAADKLPPTGYAVDYIFVEKSVKVNNFKPVDEINLSDHLGLLGEFEI